MVYLTGDTHGDIDRFKHGKLRWLGKRRIPPAVFMLQAVVL